MDGRTVVLALLGKSQMTGYEVNQWVNTILSHFLKATYGMVYPALRGLVKDGLATVETRPGERGPERRFYRLTELGRLTNEAFFRDIERYGGSDGAELLFRLFFADEPSGPAACKLMLRRICWLQDRVDELERQKDTQWEKNMTESQRLTYEYGRALFQWQIEFWRARATDGASALEN